MICGIYKITAQDGKVYIGKSKDIEKRWVNYKYSFTKLSGQPDLYASFKKFGWFNHVFEIIEECDELEMGCREFYWQHFYDVLGNNGLNMQYGSCYEISFQEQLFELKNTLFRKSVLLHLYKNENVENVNFNVRKYKQRRGEKVPRKVGSGKHRKNWVMSEETKTKLRNAPRTNSHSKKPVLDTETGVFYNSLKELCLLYNISYNSMRSRLSENGKLINHTQFIYT